MLARYQIVRGKRPPGNPLPEGRRIDTRKHTHHCLRPEAAAVEAFIRDPSARRFTRFRRPRSSIFIFSASPRLTNAVACNFPASQHSPGLWCCSRWRCCRCTRWDASSKSGCRSRPWLTERCWAYSCWAVSLRAPAAPRHRLGRAGTNTSDLGRAADRLPGDASLGPSDQAVAPRAAND